MLNPRSGMLTLGEKTSHFNPTAEEINITASHDVSTALPSRASGATGRHLVVLDLTDLNSTFLDPIIFKSASYPTLRSALGDPRSDLQSFDGIQPHRQDLPRQQSSRNPRLYPRRPAREIPQGCLHHSCSLARQPRLSKFHPKSPERMFRRATTEQDSSLDPSGWVALRSIHNNFLCSDTEQLKKTLPFLAVAFDKDPKERSHPTASAHATRHIDLATKQFVNLKQVYMITGLVRPTGHSIAKNAEAKTLKYCETLTQEYDRDRAKGFVLREVNGRTVEKYREDNGVLRMWVTEKKFKRLVEG
ncbi:hypothetical protein BKA65DRAFT_580500 [Rhexocercosporidium sp. MPI-PUGE-AT-0058]|nr:hypothetical protein BKA65DRAFT_580500 [Rhexocercosporidium sp. MPI-PUGE-AT-0058]